MGNATTTKPQWGFQGPKLAKLFAGQAINKTTPIEENKHTQSRLPVGATACGIVGSIVFVLFIAVVFILRRRQHRMAEPPEMSASAEPQEMQDCGLHELHDPKNVPELSTLPIGLDCSVPESS